MVTAEEHPETLEALVARRIREELSAGRLDELMALAARRAAAPRVEANFTGGGTMGATMRPVEASLTGEVIPPSPSQIATIEEASPRLARDLAGRSPQDINLAVNLFMAIMQILQVALSLYQITHGEPPAQTQIIQIFNETTNVIHQTTSIVVPPAQG